PVVGGFTKPVVRKFTTRRIGPAQSAGPFFARRFPERHNPGSEEGPPRSAFRHAGIRPGSRSYFWFSNGSPAMHARTRTTGFTLVEVAIVLVILGLLLGGILKGQELVTNARVRELISHQENVK